MPFSTSAKNGMLDSRTMDGIRLHSGDPGAAGTTAALGTGISNATFGAAANGVRSLTTDVTVTGLSANQSVTHFSIWTVSGSAFIGSGTISSGDVTANAAGEYKLKSGSLVSLTDA